MTSFRPIPPKQAVEVLAGAGVQDPQTLIIDFASAGLVKAYALVIETRQEDGGTSISRGSAIPTELWHRVSLQGLADHVWRGGTVRLGADPDQRWPEVNITGVSFSEKSLGKVIEHCGGASAMLPVATRAEAAERKPEEVQPAPKRLQPDLSAIPPGAVMVTVNQAMAALGLGRTKINQLMNDGRLVRIKVDRGTRIEVESIRRLAGLGT